MDSDFRKEEIRIWVVKGYEKYLDTFVKYPFKIKLPPPTQRDSLDVIIQSFLDIGVHDLKKEFFELVYVDNFKADEEKIINFPEDCIYNINFKNRICPVCFKSDKAIPVIYGLPIMDRDGHSPFDDFENYLWGCDILSCGPTWHCKRDNIEF